MLTRTRHFCSRANVVHGDLCCPVTGRGNSIWSLSRSYPLDSRKSVAKKYQFSRDGLSDCQHYSTYCGGNIILGKHVKEALENRIPVVALESTVITHGLPEPENFNLAMSLEDEVRRGEPNIEVVPATVGIVYGQLIIGLTRDQINYLANLNESRAIKCSRRDIPLAQALKLNGGTTVSGTLAIINSLGPFEPERNSLRVFATGGLGGVHLDGQNSMDISADLYELARLGDGRTSRCVGVVSSGFKSFLDTRRSLELLESLGVTVTSLAPLGSSSSRGTKEDLLVETMEREEWRETIDPKGRRSHIFPGFFTILNKQRATSPWQCQTVHEAASILFHCLGGPSKASNEQPDEWQSGGESQSTFQAIPGQRSMLLACPIPDAFALDSADSLGPNSGHTVSRQQTHGLGVDSDLGEGRGANGARGGADVEEGAPVGQFEIMVEKIGQSIDGRSDLNGYEKTPLILEELNRLTGGKSVKANLELLRNNARIGAQLAHKLALMFEGSTNAGPKPPQFQAAGQPKSTMVNNGSSAAAQAATRPSGAPKGITYEGEPHLGLGGVGNNLAAGLQLLGHEPCFITSLGDDNLGQFARSELHRRRAKAAAKLKIIQSTGEPKGGRPSSCFALVLVDSISGQCEYVIANLAAAKAISKENLRQMGLDSLLAGDELISGDELRCGPTPLVVMDANLPSETLFHVLQLCSKLRVPVFVEPTDVNCLPSLFRCLQTANRLAATGGAPSGQVGDLGGESCEQLGQLGGHPHGCWPAISMMSPNIIELKGLLELFESGCDNGGHPNEGQPLGGPDEAPSSQTDCCLSIERVQWMAQRLMQFCPLSLKCLLVTMDKRGVLVAIRGPSSKLGAPFADSLERIGLRQLICQNATIDKVGQPPKHCPSELLMKHLAPKQTIEQPISGSGAGDCFASGFISAYLDGLTLAQCLERAESASLISLNSLDAVPDELAKLRPKRGQRLSASLGETSAPIQEEER